MARRRSTKTRKRQRCRREPSKIFQFLVIISSVGSVISQHSQGGYENGETVVKLCCYNTTQTADVRILQRIGDSIDTLSTSRLNTTHNMACREERPILDFSRDVNNTLCCEATVFNENHVVDYTKVYECENFTQRNNTDVLKDSSANVPVDSTPTDAITTDATGNGDGGGGGVNVPAIVGGVIGGLVVCGLVVPFVLVVLVALYLTGYFRCQQNNNAIAGQQAQHVDDRDNCEPPNEVNAIQCTDVPEQDVPMALPAGVCSSQETFQSVVPPRSNAVSKVFYMTAEQVTRNSLKRRHNTRPSINHKSDAEPTVLSPIAIQPFEGPALPEIDDGYIIDLGTIRPQQESFKGVDTSILTCTCPQVTVLEEDSMPEGEDLSCDSVYSFHTVHAQLKDDMKVFQSNVGDDGIRKRITNPNLDGSNSNLFSHDQKFIQSSYNSPDSSDIKCQPILFNGRIHEVTV